MPREDKTLNHAEKLMKALDSIEKAVNEAREVLVSLVSDLTPEEEEEYDGWYNEDQEGFECAFEGCEEWIWETPEELTKHIKSKHGVEDPRIDLTGYRRESEIESAEGDAEAYSAEPVDAKASKDLQEK